MKKILLLVLLFAMLFCTPAYAYNTVEKVNSPKVTLYFENAETGSGNAYIGRTTRIKARAVYEGCAAEQTYTLIIQLENAQTGEICIISAGQNSIMQIFTADGEAGFFEFEFEIDATQYSGCTLRESHYLENMQTQSTKSEESTGCIYVPVFTSEAVSENGNKTVLAGNNTVICGILNYNGFAPGEEYKIVTTLKDQLTGEPIRRENGNIVSVTSKFTPSQANGQIATKISANLSEYGNHNIIVSEEVYYVPKEGISCTISAAENDQESRTVFACLTNISVLDEMYKTPIENVELSVSTTEDGASYSGITDSSGLCSFPLNSKKTSSCVVMSAPDEYNVLGGAVELTPTEADAESTFSIYLLKKNIVVLQRTDAETGLPVQGLVTQVYGENGELLGSLSSNEEGRAYFDANDYWENEAKTAGEKSFTLNLTFKDISTPSEYYPIEKEWNISIDENRNITGTVELQSYERYPVTITVTSWNKTGIQGVELTIFDENGYLQGRATTDHDGKISFVPSKTGKYRIVEGTVPSGYLQSPLVKSFVVEENGEISGTTNLTKMPADFTNNLVTVFVWMTIFLLGWFSARAHMRKTNRNKISAGEEKNTRH